MNAADKARAKRHMDSLIEALEASSYPCDGIYQQCVGALHAFDAINLVDPGDSSKYNSEAYGIFTRKIDEHWEKARLNQSAEP